MWDTLMSWYREPLFVVFALGGSAVSMVSFLLFAVPLTWIAAREPAWARPFRIQRRRGRPDMIWPSVRLWLVNNGLQLLSVVALWPLLRLTNIHMTGLPPWWEVLWQVVFFIYLDDFLYYWMHRTLHRPGLYERVHALHHRVGSPWAISAHYMHPVEYLMTAGLMLVGPALVGAHVLTIFIWIAVRQWEAAEGHCGYDFPITPSKLIPGSHGAAHHDFHHLRWQGNYGGFLPIHDRWAGTLARGYADWVARRRARGAATEQRDDETP